MAYCAERGTCFNRFLVIIYKNISLKFFATFLILVFSNGISIVNYSGIFVGPIISLQSLFLRY
jgi:hypothetical protein